MYTCGWKAQQIADIVTIYDYITRSVHDVKREEMAECGMQTVSWRDLAVILRDKNLKNRNYREGG